MPIRVDVADQKRFRFLTQVRLTVALEAMDSACLMLHVLALDVDYPYPGRWRKACAVRSAVQALKEEMRGDN